MAFPQAFLDELMERSPIEDVVGQYVSLKRKGANLFGLCPFHGEKSASFSVRPEKGMYYCFGCHKGGRVIDFMMEIEGLSYPDAIRALAKRAGMQVPEDEQYQSRYRQQERLWALNREAAVFFHDQLYSPGGAQALAYATGRGLSKSTLTKFGIGYAPNSWDALVKALLAKGYTRQEMIDAQIVSVSRKNNNILDRFRDRLMFPIIDTRRHVIGFGGRIMNNDPDAAKYLNSPESIVFNKRKNLFAMNLASKSKLGYLILVEGYMDAVALHQHGFDCAVASLGTALTQEQATLLTTYTNQVVLIYDGDNAGQNATRRAIPILEKAGLQVRVLRMRDAKDPDEFLKKYGADKFKVLLEEASNGMEYQIDVIRRKFDLSIDTERVEFIQECAQLLSTVPSSVQREVYGRRVAEMGGISYEAMKLETDKAYRRRVSREKKAQEKAALTPVRAAQPRSRTIRYDNVRSAMAEEGVISLVLREPAMLDLTAGLKEEEFSSPLLGRVFAQLRQRHAQGLAVNFAALDELTSEEASHLAGILQRDSGPVSEKALHDYIATIHAEYQKTQVTSEDDLLRLRNKMKESKGYKA